MPMPFEPMPPDIGEWDDEELQRERAAEVENENAGDIIRR